MKRLLFVSIIFILSSLMAGAYAEAPEKQIEKKTLRLGGVLPVGNSVTLASERFAELVNKRTDKSVTIEVYPASQLGKAIVQWEMVKTGSLDMYGSAIATAAEFCKAWNILLVPYLFRDQKHQEKFFEESNIYKQLEEKLIEETGVRVLAPNGYRLPRVLFAVKPIKSHKDLKDVRIRVPNWEFYIKAFKELGSRPTPIPYAEVYMALQQRIAEAADTSLAALYGMGFHKVAPYISMTNHDYSPTNIVINEKLFSSLSEPLQKILKESAKEALDYQFELDKKAFINDKPLLLKEGAKFIEVNIEEFQKALEGFVAKLEAEGSIPKGMYNKIQDIK